ncbi:hypothetical protein OKA04_18420 [Luteolibacter flavescens]|uniref:Uncharacterized protein n=1 Tax=Luteolibacter flavescens TaxID=1859460 RepID=A0ABT3FUP8_9BACT|nr:hypothetical protein [Luteolibacter flavescens]MCW1886720.1 hypothetical protein [Luteolibacter flavescens]
MKIFDESHVLIPLFHQTSSVFLPSICELGLGAVNPHERLGTYSFLRELIELAGRMKELPISELDLDILRRMAQQEITRGGFNFRHGGVYLTPSQRKAASYARGNAYGSELLSESLRLYSALKSLGIAVEAIGTRYPAVVELAESKVMPIMAVVKGVPVEHLRTERGEDPIPRLERMQAAMDELGPDQGRVLWEMNDFELCKPIPVGGFGVYHITWKDPSGRGISHRLEDV